MTRPIDGRLVLFDRPMMAAHPKGVRWFLRRAISVACVLAFVQSAVAQCAGWQATPEARLDCCESGMCPLNHRGDDVAPIKITQATADDCCAQSQDQESSPSVRIFASTMTAAVVDTTPPFVPSIVPAAPVRAPWENASPPDHVPKHLRLSVLLV